jgi:hypothetical protein
MTPWGYGDRHESALTALDDGMDPDVWTREFAGVVRALVSMGVVRQRNGHYRVTNDGLDLLGRGPSC